MGVVQQGYGGGHFSWLTLARFLLTLKIHHMFSPSASSVPFSGPCSSSRHHLAPLTPNKILHSRLCLKQLCWWFGAIEKNSMAQQRSKHFERECCTSGFSGVHSGSSLHLPLCYWTLILRSVLKEIYLLIVHGKEIVSQAVSLNWSQKWESCTICSLNLFSSLETLPDLSMKQRGLKAYTTSLYIKLLICKISKFIEKKMSSLFLFRL